MVYLPHMGLFDTIHLKSPLVCPTCGRQEHDYQTHAFDDVMANYRIKMMTIKTESGIELP